MKTRRLSIFHSTPTQPQTPDRSVITSLPDLTIQFVESARLGQNKPHWILVVPQRWAQGLRKQYPAEITLNYQDFPESGLPATGCISSGHIGDTMVLISDYPENYEKNRLKFSATIIRIAQHFGVGKCFLGGVGEAGKSGSERFVVIHDHINLTGVNPLIGPNDPKWGTRFPDMTAVYTAELRKSLYHILREVSDLEIREGILVSCPDRKELSPAELQALEETGECYFSPAILHEAIVARHGKMEIAGLLRIAGSDNVADSMDETQNVIETLFQLVQPPGKKST